LVDGSRLKLYDNAALPSDVRKAYGLPHVVGRVWATPRPWAQPRVLCRLTEARSASAHQMAEPRVAG